MSDDIWLPQIVGRLVRAMDPARIVLFGSRARGDQRPDSDYDLLVVLDDVDDRRAARLEVRRLLDDLPISKDVIVAVADIENSDYPPSGALYWALMEGTAIYDRCRVRHAWRRCPVTTQIALDGPFVVVCNNNVDRS